MTHSLVVGGTRGIGRAVARLFAAAGHTVSVIGRRPPAESDRVAGIHYWTVDLLDRDGTTEALREMVAMHGKLHHVVFMQRYRGQGDPWSGEVETTLTATKAVIDALTESFGDDGKCAIVMISSIIGDYVVENQPVGYHVAKVGLNAMVRYYAVKLGPRGIRVNGVAPCTMLKEESKAFYLGDPEQVKFFHELSPLGRMGTSEDVAAVVQFLCGPQASFITGQILTVDGGTSLVWHELLARKFATAMR